MFNSQLLFLYLVQWLFLTFLLLASKNKIKMFSINAIVQIIYTALFFSCSFFMTSIEGEAKIIFALGLVISLLIHTMANIVLLIVLLIQDWKKR